MWVGCPLAMLPVSQYAVDETVAPLAAPRLLLAAVGRSRPRVVVGASALAVGSAGLTAGTMVGTSPASSGVGSAGAAVQGRPSARVWTRVTPGPQEARRHKAIAQRLTRPEAPGRRSWLQPLPASPARVPGA